MGIWENNEKVKEKEFEDCVFRKGLLLNWDCSVSK